MVSNLVVHIFTVALCVRDPYWFWLFQTLTHFSDNYVSQKGLPRWCSGEEPACQFRRCGFDPWTQEDPLEKAMAAYSSILAWRNFMDRGD